MRTTEEKSWSYTLTSFFRWYPFVEGDTKTTIWKIRTNGRLLTGLVHRLVWRSEPIRAKKRHINEIDDSFSWKTKRVEINQGVTSSFDCHRVIGSETEVSTDAVSRKTKWCDILNLVWSIPVFRCSNDTLQAMWLVWLVQTDEINARKKTRIVIVATHWSHRYVLNALLICSRNKVNLFICSVGF